MNLSNTLAGVFEPKQQTEKDRQRFSNRDLFRQDQTLYFRFRQVFAWD